MIVKQARYPDIDIGPVRAAYSPSKSFLDAVTVQYARQFAAVAVPAATWASSR